MPTRRQLLQGAAALGALAPRRARASVAPEDRRFVFVTAYFGWDQTRVFAPEFDNPVVDMDLGAEPATVGGLRYVAHPERPSVTAFMEGWSDRILVLNGELVSSVAHDICLYRQMTGGTRQDAPDWPSILGHAAAARYVLPSVVVRGPSFPGPLSPAVCRIGSSGQTAALLNGDLVSWGEKPVAKFGADASAAMDRYTAAAIDRRALSAFDPHEIAILDATGSALRSATAIEGLVDQIAWGPTGDRALPTQSAIARDLLKLGVARCVSLYHDRITWDSHAGNDPIQSANFEELFAGLVDLMEQLDTTLDRDGRLLSETTTVVVLSEMGRSPTLNSAEGKDHWPYAAMMIVGDGLTTNRCVGGYDDFYYGRRLDPDTAEIDDERGVELTPGVIGATLLELGGVDWREWVVNDAAMGGLLG